MKLNMINFDCIIEYKNILSVAIFPNLILKQNQSKIFFFNFQLPILNILNYLFYILSNIFKYYHIFNV